MGYATEMKGFTYRNKKRVKNHILHDQTKLITKDFKGATTAPRGSGQRGGRGWVGPSS